MKRKFVVLDVTRGWDHALQVGMSAHQAIQSYDTREEAEQWIRERPTDMLGMRRYTVQEEFWTNG